MIKKKKSNEINYTNINLWKVFIGILIILLSSITIGTNGEIMKKSIFSFSFSFFPLESLFKLPEAMIYLLFGTLHAWFNQEKEFEYNSEKENNKQILTFVGNMFLFTGFYKLILLPACGFGYIEWGALGLIFLYEFSIIHKNKKLNYKIKMKDGWLVFIGLFLCIFKLIVRYAFSNNLSHHITGNNTVMSFLFYLIMILMIFGIRTFISLLKLTNSEKSFIKDTTKNIVSIGKKILNVFLSIIKTIGKVLQLLIDPSIFIIFLSVIVLLSIGIFLITGLAIEYDVEKMKWDITKFLIPIINFLLETDSAAYIDDKLNTVGTISSLIIFLIMYFYDRIKIKAYILQIEEQKKHHEIDSNIIKSMHTNNSEKQIEEFHNPIINSLENKEKEYEPRINE